MERTISDEEKIRRAIEISRRRNNNDYYKLESTRVNVNNKKDYKLFKKMILQIIICLVIYGVFYLVSSTNYIFSEQIIQNANDILNYDINFHEFYNNFIVFVNTKIKENETINNEENIENNSLVNEIQENIENTTQNDTENIVSNNIENSVENNTSNSNVTNENKVSKEKTQMELDAEEVKRLCDFSKPLSGTITSEFGTREVLFDGMSSDHKGIDIAAKSGTNIKAAISGTVSVAEENSEYGKFIKIINGDIMTVYAHCQKLKVKVGDKITIRTNHCNCWLYRKFNRATFAFRNKAV